MKKRFFVAAAAIILSIFAASSALAAYFGTYTLEGKATLAIPKGNFYFFDRLNAEEAAEVLYGAACDFLAQGGNPENQKLFIAFVGWDFTEPTRGGKGGRSEYEVELSGGRVEYVEYEIGPNEARYPASKPTESMSCIEWLGYMMGENSTVYQYFETRGGRGKTLDSDGRNFAPLTWSEVRALVQRIGGDPADVSGWRIWMDSDDIGWNIFWTTTDLSTTKNGDILPYVWKYNSKTEQIQEGYATARSKSLEGYTIMEINGGAMVFGEHPVVETPEPAPLMMAPPEPMPTGEPELLPTEEPAAEPEPIEEPVLTEEPEGE